MKLVKLLTVIRVFGDHSVPLRLELLLHLPDDELYLNLFAAAILATSSTADRLPEQRVGQLIEVSNCTVGEYRVPGDHISCPEEWRRIESGGC